MTMKIFCDSCQNSMICKYKKGMRTFINRINTAYKDIPLKYEIFETGSICKYYSKKERVEPKSGTDLFSEAIAKYLTKEIIPTETHSCAGAKTCHNLIDPLQKVNEDGPKSVPNPVPGPNSILPVFSDATFVVWTSLS